LTQPKQKIKILDLSILEITWIEIEIHIAPTKIDGFIGHGISHLDFYLSGKDKDPLSISLDIERTIVVQNRFYRSNYVYVVA
jgi:hypothetical protein